MILGDQIISTYRTLRTISKSHSFGSWFAGMLPRSCAPRCLCVAYPVDRACTPRSLHLITFNPTRPPGLRSLCSIRTCGSTQLSICVIGSLNPMWEIPGFAARRPRTLHSVLNNISMYDYLPSTSVSHPNNLGVVCLVFKTTFLV